MTRSLEDWARVEWSLKIVERIKVGDGGRLRDNVFFHPAKMDSNLGGVAIFSDTIDGRRQLRSYGIWSTPGADKFGVRTVSFVVWTVD